MIRPSGIGGEDGEYQRAVGSRLRAARKDRGWTRMQADAASGIHMRTIASYELGQRSITVARLRRLASAYGVSPASLLPERDEIRSVAQLAADLRVAAGWLERTTGASEQEAS